jgi:hypothetical protein
MGSGGVIYCVWSLTFRASRRQSRRGGVRIQGGCAKFTLARLETAAGEDWLGR